MIAFRSTSLTEQAAAHLKMEILQGSLVNTLPGVRKLAAEMGIHHTTAEEALQILEKEGLIESRGAGRKRAILPTENFVAPSMRVGILPYEDADRSDYFLLDLQHRLQQAGHVICGITKTLQTLGMNAQRVARFAKDQDVDAWIVVAGPRPVLEWFAAQPTPVFSLFGRRRNVNIASAGPDKLPAMIQLLDRLVELGHRRIVMLLREEHRKPSPGFVAQSMLNAMETHGLPTGSYNLPDWDNDPKDLRRCLNSLFRNTPPTALIVDEVFLFNVVQQQLARMGILAPRDISLLCTDPDPTFEWHDPSIAHVHWDSQKVMRRILRWANNIARGKQDTQPYIVKAEFIEGGTIGPVPKTTMGKDFL